MVRGLVQGGGPRVFVRSQTSSIPALPTLSSNQRQKEEQVVQMEKCGGGSPTSAPKTQLEATELHVGTIGGEPQSSRLPGRHARS